MSQLSKRGYALVCKPLNVLSESEPFSNSSAAKGIANLQDKENSLDKSPILRSCNCEACRNYSRGYIHHLLKTKELLADVLLAIHNHFVYLEFFEEIRRSLRENMFHEFKTQFLAAYCGFELPKVKTRPPPKSKSGWAESKRSKKDHSYTQQQKEKAV